MGIKELFLKLAEDKDFAAKYQALPNLDAILAQAKEDGYSITKEELEAVLQKPGNGELSDEALEGVAGGLFSSINLKDYAINSFSVDGEFLTVRYRKMDEETLAFHRND